MSEIPTDIPVPLVNYVQLIRNRRSPYYDIVNHLVKEMEIHYEKMGEISETVYTINPRILQGDIEKLVKDEKLTTVNVCRTILALLYGSSLRQEKDFYVTTTSSGRRNYHVKVNTKTLSCLATFL
jgi:hypothetical protein